jgi:hypothetical protein
MDFAIDHEQALPFSFRRMVPASTLHGHVETGSVDAAAERN